MTQYFQDLLGKLRSPEPVEKKEHHLFLLGTGVNYVDRPTDPAQSKFYIRGETFSYAAQLMSQLLDEEGSVQKKASSSDKRSSDYAHSYHSDSVDVIDGPDTAGFEVGDRLAKSFMLALGAVAEGKTTLGISGFSRGAVESIVLTHELERVRAALEEDLAKPVAERRSLTAIIKDSKTVPGLLKASYGRHALEYLESLEGPSQQQKPDDDEDLKAKLLNNLNQLQVNLFVLDPVPGGNFGKVVRLGWQEDSFYQPLPAFVKQKQEFVQKHETSNCFKAIVPLGMPYEVLPGCHGTGDGNQFDHNGQPVPDTLVNRDLSGVQDLVLRRWLDFTFPEGHRLGANIDFGHPELDAVTNEYLPASQAARNAQLLENYQHIQNNYGAFEWLASRNYTGLGRYMAERQIHFHQRGNTPVTTLDAHGDGRTFLNLQHVKLWMSNTLQESDFFNKTLVGQVQWLKENIEVAFGPENPDAPVSPQSQMVAELLKDPNKHELMKESLSYLVNTVALTYLRNHLSTAERAECRSCVQHTFSTLARAAAEPLNTPEMTALAQSLTQRIREDLTSIILQHQNALLSLANKLTIDEKMVLANLDSMPQEAGTAQEADTEAPLLSWLMDAQKLAADLNLLKEQIPALEEWCDQEALINNWSKQLPQYGVASDGVSYPASRDHLLNYIEQQERLLMMGASRILSKMPNALKDKPQELEDRFYNEIYKVASIDTVQSQLATTAQELQNTAAELSQVTQAKNDLEKGLLSTTDQHGELEVLARSLKDEADALRQELSKAQETMTKQAEENRQSKQQLDEREEQLQAVRKELTGAQERLETLTESKQFLQSRIGKLEQLNETASVELTQVQTEHQNAKETIESLDSQVQTNADTLQNAQEEIAKLNLKLQAQTQALLAAQALIAANAHATVIDHAPIIDLAREAEMQQMEKQIEAYRSPEERAVIIKIDKLNLLTTEYLAHLIKSDDGSPLMEAKIASTHELLGHLNNTQLLPSEQLVAFNETLEKTQETLKEHRDPTWMRFFRDCARIVAMTLSGVGLYRMATGKPPHFFKPSVGEDFVQAVQEEEAPLPTAKGN